MPRFLNFFLALVVLVTTFWVVLGVHILVRATSSGPGLFRQLRIGHNGNVFTCYKFRTMYVGTPDVATHEASRDAITPVGRFLRRTKLDELPQLINILCGDMNFVGPRPCLPQQKELVDCRQSDGVLQVFPGITGLAQINGIDMSRPKLLSKIDKLYISKASFCFDIEIGIRTFLGAGRGDKVR